MEIAWLDDDKCLLLSWEKVIEEGAPTPKEDPWYKPPVKVAVEAYDVKSKALKMLSTVVSKDDVPCMAASVDGKMYVVGLARSYTSSMPMVQRSARWNPSMNTAAAEASVWAQMENTSLWPLLKWKWRWWVWMAQKFSTTRSVGITSQRLVCTGGTTILHLCSPTARLNCSTSPQRKSLDSGLVPQRETVPILIRSTLWECVLWRVESLSWPTGMMDSSFVSREEMEENLRWKKLTNFMKENMDFTTAPDLSSLKTNRQSSMKGPKATETMQTPNQTTW